MEPFVAEKEERLSTGSPRHKPQKSRNRRSPVLAMAVVLLIVAGALLAMLYAQQRSFESLQDNFLDLRSRLEQPAESQEPSDDAPQAEGGQAAESNPSVSSLEKKVADLERTVAKLDDRIKRVADSVPDGQSAGSSQVDSLAGTTAQLESAIASLREEVLGVKFSLEELQSNMAARRTGVDRRLDSMERAVMSLNEFRRGMTTTNSGMDPGALADIRRELELLRKQHPYLED